MGTKFKSDITLGEEYEDTITGIKGKATSLYFFLHACERVCLEFIKDGEVKDIVFDAPRLRHIKSGEVATTTRTGGHRPVYDTSHTRPIGG